VLLPLLQRILRLKELPGREVQQVPAPLQSKRHRQALLLVLMPVLLPSGAVPHDLTQLLLFQKLLRYEPQLS
jgi:ParB-like chromosome segregation protein Spo0J